MLDPGFKASLPYTGVVVAVVVAVAGVAITAGLLIWLTTVVFVMLLITCGFGVIFGGRVDITVDWTVCNVPWA